MDSPISFYCGHYVPRDEVAISPFDLGFLQGVTVTERARTFGGELFRWASHLRRLRRSLEIIDCQIPYSDDQLTQIAERLVYANHKRLPKGADLAVCVFVTPGVSDAHHLAHAPTVGMYTVELDFGEYARLHASGQPLWLSTVRQTSPRCWPSELKCRSRMHYYLADQEARRHDPTARAILLDERGFVSEASTANLIAYFRAEGLVSPPLEMILPGVSLQVLEAIARRRRIPWTYRDLTPDELFAADELLLCSTSPCVVPAVSLDGRPIGDGRPGRIFRQLLRAWSELVGRDIAQQAIEQAQLRGS